MHIQHDAPIETIKQWLNLARTSEINDPTAMSIATVNADSIPALRMVLLKNITDTGDFCFNTNKNSDKARDIRHNPNVALLFHWKSLRRQVRIVGTATPLTHTDNQKYFETRSTISQMGAWASDQSQPLDSRQTLLKRVEELTEKFQNTTPIPCPDHWGGYKVTPNKIELWIDGQHRLHDRFMYTPIRKDGHIIEWTHQRLYP